MSTTKWRRVALLLLCSHIACGGDSPSGIAGTVDVASVDMFPLTLSLAPGGTGLLKATPKSGIGVTVPGLAVEWQSSNPAVATVNNGTVTGIGAGTAQIRATVDGLTATASVTVSPNAPRTYALSITPNGVGSGIVRAAAVGGQPAIECYMYGDTSEGLCGNTYLEGTTVVLTSAPPDGYIRGNTNFPTNVFAGWSGACSGTATCSLTISQSRSVNARFDPQPYELQLSVPTPAEGDYRSVLYATVVVPPGATQLRVAAPTYGGAAPAVPYVRFGSLPTTSTYDCAVLNGDFASGCVVNAPSAGTWYIALRGFSGTRFNVLLIATKTP